MPTHDPRWRLAIFALLLAVVCLSAGGEQPAEPPPGRTVLDQRPGEGERCIVCKQEVHGDEVLEIRYKGRRFHVKADMLDEFDAEPLAYFVDLQARSGLFDERAVATREMSLGWLAFGTYVVIGLVFSALCGYLAIGRGHPPLPWFFAGLAGNLAALAVLLATPRKDLGALPAGVPPGLAKVPSTRSPVPCPSCGTSNHPAAAACGGCGAELTPTAQAETARVRRAKSRC